MPFQVSPGINISEIDLTHVVPNVATSIGAIAGAFQWGPVMERTSITTENDLVKTFGKPSATSFLAFHTASNYLAYSNNLLVVRCVGDNAKNAVVGNAVAGTPFKTDNVTDYDTDIGAYEDQLFVAKYPGVLGNSLKVHAIDSAGWAASVSAGAATELQDLFKANFDRAPSTSTDVKNANGGSHVAHDEVHVMVIDEDGLWTGQPGQIIETHAYLSKAIDAKRIDGSSNYIGTVLRNESEYIYLGKSTELTELSVDAGSEVDAGAVKTGSVFKRMNSAVDTQKFPGGSLSGGHNGGAIPDNCDITSGQLRAGYALYINPEVVDVTLIIGGQAVIANDNQYLVKSIAEKRMDCIALVSPLSDDVVQTTGETDKLVAASTGIGSSSYGVLDSAWKYQYDRYNDVFRYIPMCGDIAGLCARTDFTNDAWWSPAGMTRGTIKNIVKLSWEPTKADRDKMYQNNVNPLITMKGAGVLLWGDKTLQTVPSAFDRINVRRLFIVLEKAIAIAAKAMLFEFNDEFTRAQFVNMVAPFLREVQGRRGITDFKVVCDSSNNTGQVIDTNNFVGDIYIKPARSINFIQLNFIAARTDVSFSEIGG